MPEVVNIAAYQFLPLANLAELRERLRAQCKAWGLRGTILLSPEGINLFVAGERSRIELLLQALRSIPGLDTFQPKVSISASQPFNRMLVRIKREIIAFGVPGIEPGRQTSPKIAPGELKQWLDSNRPLTLLDTRNEYEIKLGTFKNAVSLGIDHFRDFPAAALRLPAELKRQPLVMFCTGGIRCEKAGPYLERAGFEQVFQLDGGILNYFEACGGAHYDGECFVFDQRVGLDPQLGTTEHALCFHCLAPLTPADRLDSRYDPERSCPACFVSESDQRLRTLTAREEAIQRATTPLPGSAPYDNFRPLTISAKFSGDSLSNALGKIFPHLPPAYWLDRFAQNLILDRHRQAVTAEQCVQPGEIYLHRMPASTEPAVNVAIRVLHEDAALVVIHKPAPLPLHPSGRYNRNSLQWILNQVYQPEKPRPAHRLDANTSGVVVFARTRRFAALLQAQFAAGAVEKRYLARIQGHPPEDRFSCAQPIGSATTELGGRGVDEQGQPARTEFEVLQRLADGTSLVLVRPLTGRTNQIRVHLWHLGWPIRGEQAYLANQARGDTQTHALTDPPLCLHAHSISFLHPLTQERVTYVSTPPPWADFASELPPQDLPI